MFKVNNSTYILLSFDSLISSFWHEKYLLFSLASTIFVSGLLLTFSIIGLSNLGSIIIIFEFSWWAIDFMIFSSFSFHLDDSEYLFYKIRFLLI